MERYYRDQLQRLREGASEFARRHPAVAPMMLAESGDPDVERILEGTAWLCAKIQQRLDQTAPNLIQSLLRLVFPQAILPIPSTTLIRFTPYPGFDEAFLVPEGTQLASHPVDGVPCIYSTSQTIQVLPLALVRLGKEGATLTLTLASAVPLQRFLPNTLVFYCTGTYAEASDRFVTLVTRTQSVSIQAGGARVTLSPKAVRQHTLPLTDIRLPGSRRLNRGYMELLRYFHFPEQLLAIDVEGFERLSLAGDETSMTVTFHLEGRADTLPPFPEDAITLNVTPAANVFRVSAEPITIDHTREEYLIRPQNGKQLSLETLGVEEATAMLPGGRTMPLRPYEAFDADDTGLFYSLRFRPSEKNGTIEHVLTPLYRQNGSEAFIERAVLSLELLCCNHSLPASLQAGDICQPTDTSPAQASFTNLMAPTPMLPCPVRESLQWRFLSLMNTNLLSLASPKALTSLLELYLPEAEVATELAAAGARRIQAVTDFSSSAEERLFGGRLLRGRLLALTLDPAGFVSHGDLYLFANALDRFFAGFANLNTYSRLALTIANTGEQHLWPPRLGEKQLI